MLDTAIIGLGRWGQILVDSVQNGSDKIRFVRGETRTPSKAESFAQKHGFPLGNDYAAALQDPGVQAIALATPHSQHADQIEQAAVAGKHIFVEKPFTLTKATAETSVAAAEKAGVVLALGHNRRFLPGIAALREKIANGDLGQILHVEANFSGGSGLSSKPGMWRAGLEDNPAGGMTAMGIHMVDTMIDLFGKMTEVCAESFRQVIDLEIDDTTAVLLRFASGMSGNLVTINATAPFWRVHVVGTGGWAELHSESRLSVRSVDGKEDKTEFPADFSKERAELEAFADAVAGNTHYPLPAADAIHGIAVLEAIAQSAERRVWTDVA